MKLRDALMNLAITAVLVLVIVLVALVLKKSKAAVPKAIPVNPANLTITDQNARPVRETFELLDKTTLVETRANEAAARVFWPLGNTKLEKRLPLIKAPTLVLWGDQDKIMPKSYAQTIAKAIGHSAKVQMIKGAGHLAELDQPDAVAKAVLEFTG